MAVNNKPEDDAKAMTQEYVKGVSIDALSEKYNHTTEEVEAIVTTPVAVDEPLPTQVELDSKKPETVTDKKVK